jgi:hypothetical protein
MLAKSNRTAAANAGEWLTLRCAEANAAEQKTVKTDGTAYTKTQHLLESGRTCTPA